MMMAPPPPPSTNCSVLTYKTLYELRLELSDYKEKNIHFLLDTTKNYFSTPKKYSILSVGPRDGTVEEKLLNSNMKIETLDLIEPNTEYVSSLEKKFLDNNNVNVIEEIYKASSISKKYDFILMNQVSHLFKDPVKEITDSLALLNAQGKLVIVLHSEKGMHYFRKKIAEKYKEYQMRQLMIGEDLSSLLKDKGIAHTIDFIDSSMNLEPCLDTNTKKFQDLISFIFLYNFTKCNNTEIIEDIRNDFLQKSVGINKRLPEPMMIFSIEA